MNRYVPTNCDFCGIELNNSAVCAHCERKYMPKGKDNHYYEKEAKIDDNFIAADDYVAHIEALEAESQREWNKKHGTPDKCMYCGHEGMQEIDFAEPECCHICIKR